MSARILITDDNPLNVKLLSAKLAREYYTVIATENGHETLKRAVEEKPDLILLDVMMPELDGFETCRRLKTDPLTRNIPVVMVTALSDTQDRIRGLDAGADDFLTKPINDIALFARVRSCLRLKALMDEWRLRESSNVLLSPEREDNTMPAGQIAVLDDQSHEQALLKKHIEHVGMKFFGLSQANELPGLLKQHPIDVCMINIHTHGDESLRVCAQLKAGETTRQLPVVVYADESDMGRIAKALDIGVNDYIFKPVDMMELQARLRTQIRQKRAYDRLRLSYEKNMAMAVTDPLTGAYNRHYLEQNLPRLFDRSKKDGKVISIAIVDIDHFKKINDTYGHHAGDQVLQEVVRRLQASIRFFDMVVRLGGEEFAVVMPDAPYAAALQAAERLRQTIAESPLPISVAPGALNATMSVGVATSEHGQIAAVDLLQLADKALYLAKETGRNKVVGAKEL